MMKRLLLPVFATLLVSRVWAASTPTFTFSAAAQPTVNAVPARAVVFTHTLTNEGTETDTFTITVTPPGGWTADPIDPIMLAANANQAVLVSVTPPAGQGAGSYPFDVTASSSIPQPTQTRQDTVVVVGAAVPQLSAGQTKDATQPLPTTVSFTHQLSNVGNQAGTFSLSAAVQGAPAGWSAAPSQPSCSLVQNSSCTFTVNVTVPANALAGPTDIVVTASIAGPPFATDSVTDSVQVPAPPTPTATPTDTPTITPTDTPTATPTSTPTATLGAATGRGYISVDASGPGGCSQPYDIQAIDPATLPADPGFIYPFGLVSLKLNCATSATITLTLHGGANSGIQFTEYRKFGPVAPNFAGPSQFYMVPGATFGTTVIAGEGTVPTVTFTLTDGQLGDSTGVDGLIVDPGGPVVPLPAAPMTSHRGMALLALSLAAVGCLALWRLGTGTRGRNEPLDRSA